MAMAVANVIRAGLAQSAHDCSEGGLLVAASEMAFAGGLGLKLDLALLPTAGDLDSPAECFAETPSRYLLEVRRDDLDAIDAIMREHVGDVRWAIVGEFNESGRLTLDAAGVDIEIEDLRSAWRGTLDW